LSLIKPNAESANGSTDAPDCVTRQDLLQEFDMPRSDRPPSSSASSRKERLAEALRANLLRRKGATTDAASQDSKHSADQPTDEIIAEESGR
jgi:hypothetical protein